jgi:hypothetical protein
LRRWLVATAPGSDFASNRLKFESNCSGILVRVLL